MDIAVAAAKRAYKLSWGLKVSGYERGRLLNKLADLLEEHKDEVAALEALDGGELAVQCSSVFRSSQISMTGKVFLHASLFDVPRAISVARYFAGWADKNFGQTIEVCNTFSLSLTKVRLI